MKRTYSLLVGSAAQKSDRESSGFTIVELLIATAVFSLVLMVAIAGFLQIGRLFFKGVIVTKTQTVAKQVLNVVSADMQNSSAIADKATSGRGYTFFCVGGNRYTLSFNTRVDLANPDNLYDDGDGVNFGVLRDKLPGAAACAAPCVDPPHVCQPEETALQSPTELLGNGMRLDVFCIAKTGSQSDLRNVKVRVLSGDDETLRDVTVTSATCPRDEPPDTDIKVCDARLQISQFCAHASVSNIVFVGGF